MSLNKTNKRKTDKILKRKTAEKKKNSQKKKNR